MRRKEWIAVVAMCGLISCTQTEQKDNQLLTPMKFTGYVQKATKGQAFTGNKLNQAFRVTAYAVAPGEGIDTESLVHVMSQQLVTTADNGVSYQYAPLMFFPYEKELICCAYSPESVPNMIYHPDGAETDHPFMSVEIPEEVSEQQDIMIAYATGITSLNAVNGISLNFKHILSQVTFAAKTSQANLKLVIKKIQIADVANEGDCFYSHTPEFAQVSGSETYAQTFSGAAGDVFFDNPGFKILTNSNNAMLLLPQNLNLCRLSVTYDAYIKLPGEESYETPIAVGETKSVLLTGKWESGMAYRYELSIQPGTPLKFETSVNSWIERTNSLGL